MDYADLLSTLRYIGSTPPAVLAEQLIDEVGNTYTKENEPPTSENSQLASGARRDYQSSKYSGNPSMESALAKGEEYLNALKRDKIEGVKQKELGVIMTPEAVKELEAKKQALIQKRMDLERKRRMDEYDQRAQARGLRVQDNLEKIGLGK
jgi:hypothetical protein